MSEEQALYGRQRFPSEQESKPKPKKDPPIVVFLYTVSVILAIFGTVVAFGKSRGQESDTALIVNGIRGLVMVCFGIFLLITGLVIRLSEDKK